MSFLETVYIGSDRNLEDFRFPVQYVNRPHLDFPRLLRNGRVGNHPARRRSHGPAITQDESSEVDCHV